MLKNKYLSFFFLFLWFIGSPASYGQNENPKDWFIEAESYYLFEEYKDALPLYQRILRVEPDNYNVLSRVGVCYLNDLYQTQKAIPYLEQAVEHIDFQYKWDTYREKMAPPETQYYLGRAYHVNNMFNKAIESYQRFLNFASPDEFDLDVVKADIEACQMAKKVFSHPVYFSPKNLGSTINSRSEDINPVISGDGKILVFTRKLPFYSGVFISVRNENGIWSPPVNLTAEFGLDGDSYSTGISYFGDEIFVYRSDNYDGNIYSSKRINNKWSRLEKLNENINTKFWESHASPSPDGQFLIFTSNREGGYGGLDIYKSQRSSNGEWGRAVNLGPVVNSPNNEDTPFLSSEGHSLFFSSQGHNTMGGYDVFISTLRSDGTWSVPVNMGYPVNTTNDNLFYCPIGVDAFGLYAMYDEETTEGLLDIYEVEVYNEKIPRSFHINGMINLTELDDISRSKLRAKLLKASTRELVDEQKIDAEGNFSLKGTQGDFVLVVEGEGIEPFQKNIELDLNRDSDQLAVEDIKLVKTEKPFEPVAVKQEEVKQGVEAKNDFYAVTDSMAVPIELILPRGSDLKVVVRVDDSLIIDDLITDVRRRFTYFYKPQAGENVLKFTATDPEGNVSETSVVVTYYEPKPIRAEIPEITEATYDSIKNPTFIASVASDPLRKYLNEIDVSAFDSYSALYDHLVTEAGNQEFDAADVQKMFSLFFSQRDLALFIREFNSRHPLPDSVTDALKDGITYPYEYIDKLSASDVIEELALRNTLLDMVIDPGLPRRMLYFALSSYSGTVDLNEEAGRVETNAQAWELLSDEFGEEKAGDFLNLAASTEKLDYFYQNLLVSSTGALHDSLVNLNMERSNIYNSIDLAEYLFNRSSDIGFNTTELLETLEKAQMNRAANLERFHLMLTEAAEGILKSQLLLANEQMEENAHFEDLLNYLLSQSKYKNYSRESVYDLLLKLIGIQDVEEFVERLMSYGYSEINNAIADTTLTYFSNPMELVQYLIAATQNYNFTASDINNLLIRMILERGLREKGGGVYDDELQKKFWKSKRFIATVILVNIVLLILIILFSIRKKKSDSDQPVT